MFVMLVALLSMLFAMLLMMFLKEREADKQRHKKFVCENTTAHTLRIHTYDQRGQVFHRCRCGTRIEYADASGWCAICADPVVEVQARRAFFRKIA
jgi:hypothetical protein